MKCAIHQEESRKYVFKFMADSGEVFLKSEPYPYYSGCVTGARTVIKYSGDTTKSHQKKSKDDQFYFFEMEGDLEQTLGASPMYKTHEKRVWAIEQLMRLKGKTLEDLMDLSIKQRKDFARGTLNEYDYVAYQSEKDQLFYFELLDFSNLMFVSVPHENRQSCKEAILALKDLVPHAKSYRITKHDGGKYNFDVIDENKKKLGTSVTLYGREETGNMISVMAGRDRARIMTEEEKRLAKKRREDAERALEEKKRKDAERKAENKKRKDAQKIIDAEKREADRREAERLHRAEQKRLAELAAIEEERAKAEKLRLAEEAKKAEEERLAEEARKAEERRIAKARKKEEKRRLAEEKKKIKEEKIAAKIETRAKEKAVQSNTDASSGALESAAASGGLMSKLGLPFAILIGFVVLFAMLRYFGIL